MYLEKLMKLIKTIVMSIILIIVFSNLAELSVLILYNYLSEINNCIVEIHNNKYYNKIENLTKNGYIVYVDENIVDFDKKFINNCNYVIDDIYINDALKEIYIYTDEGNLK